MAPEGDTRLFVVQRNGLIRIFDQQGIEQGTFLDISDQTNVFSERGLLGLALSLTHASRVKAAAFFLPMAYTMPHC